MNKKRGAVVYCGPSVYHLLKQYQVFTGDDLPKYIEDFISEYPTAKELFVPVGEFESFMDNLCWPDTKEARLFEKLKNELPLELISEIIRNRKKSHSNDL